MKTFHRKSKSSHQKSHNFSVSPPSSDPHHFILKYQSNSYDHGGGVVLKNTVQIKYVERNEQIDCWRPKSKNSWFCTIFHFEGLFTESIIISWAMFGFMQTESVEVPGSCMTLFEIATDKRFPMDMRKKVLEIIRKFGKRGGVDDLPKMLSVHSTMLNVFLLKMKIIDHPIQSSL